MPSTIGLSKRTPTTSTTASASSRGGIDVLVAATRPLLEFETARTGYLRISEKFRHLDDFGPTSVRQFVNRPDVLGERTADQWQQDAFGQVDAWLSASGLR